MRQRVTRAAPCKEHEAGFLPCSRRATGRNFVLCRCLYLSNLGSLRQPLPFLGPHPGASPLQGVTWQWGYSEVLPLWGLVNCPAPFLNTCLQQSMFPGKFPVSATCKKGLPGVRSCLGALPRSGVISPGTSWVWFLQPN